MRIPTKKRTDSNNGAENSDGADTNKKKRTDRNHGAENSDGADTDGRDGARPVSTGKTEKTGTQKHTKNSLTKQPYSKIKKRIFVGLKKTITKK